MQVKRYCCRDVREALQQIRRDLGPNAVVLGTRELPDTAGGRRGRPRLEVTAAVDPEAAYGPAATPLAAPAPELTWLVELLVADGIATPLAESLVDRVGHEVSDHRDIASLRRALAATIRARLQIESPPWDAGQGRVVYLLGPAGSGKTTSLAKIAAMAAYAESLNVTIITTDTRRPGANARLEALGQAMELPTLWARGPWQLRELVAGLGESELILVDTAPLLRDLASVEELKGLMSAAPGRRLLCLPADGATASLMRTARRYEELGVDGLIATRTDEALGLGAVFSAACWLGRPLTLLTSGPSVPGDVEIPRANALSSRILSSGPDLVREGKSDGRSRHVA